jgi:hypothetical protein
MPAWALRLSLMTSATIFPTHACADPPCSGSSYMLASHAYERLLIIFFARWSLFLGARMWRIAAEHAEQQRKWLLPLILGAAFTLFGAFILFRSLNQIGGYPMDLPSLLL